MKVWIYETSDGRFNCELESDSIDSIPEAYATSQFTSFEALANKRPYGMKATFIVDSETPPTEEQLAFNPNALPTIVGHYELLDNEDLDAYAKLSLLAKARQERDALLAACDWTQVPDSPLSPEDKATWAIYRQNLRNMPQNQSVETIYSYSDWVFPSKPE
jgi:hypothetical protein